MLLGDGYNYIDGLENIEVTVEKNKVRGPGKTANDFYSHIGFKISRPTSRYVNFKGVFLDYLNPEEYDCVDLDIGYPCCVFPLSSNPCVNLVSNNCANCACMEDFMNNDLHPHSDYSFFLIELDAFDKDILTMDTGKPYQLGKSGHYHDHIQMDFRYQTGNKEPIYHNIYCSKSAHEDPLNIWITRTGENTWTIDVGTKYFPQFLFLEEYYFEKGNKFYSTLFQGGFFHFTFDLVRTPPSN